MDLIDWGARMILLLIGGCFSVIIIIFALDFVLGYIETVFGIDFKTVFKRIKKNREEK